MAVMSTINLAVEVAEPRTGLAQAVFNELVDQLQQLADNGKHHVIDLTSLPMNDCDKRELEALLGQGEVQVTLSTIGESRIIETAYSGIWLIKHYTADEKLISELIEITDIPEIITSHPDDIKQAANEIKAASPEVSPEVSNNSEQENIL